MVRRDGKVGGCGLKNHFDSGGGGGEKIGKQNKKIGIIVNLYVPTQNIAEIFVLFLPFFIQPVVLYLSKKCFKHEFLRIFPFLWCIVHNRIG